MEKTYNPHTIEQKLYQQWETSGYFKADGTGDSYCIVLPPPNVTGALHMGHGFQDTLMDALIRYHRMCGFNTLWQAGTDHAGIATQMVVERQLLKKGQSRHQLGRDAFVDKIWEWKEQYGDKILQQLRRMGASADWTRARFTLDEELSKAVRKVFVQLFDEGLIYRGKRLVNWDPVLHTAISDLEVTNEEESGHLWHFRYPLTDNKNYLVIATTRPETMLGDTAVAVHPDDERYKSFIGKTIKLPLTNREIPIIADDYVDPEFGTGCVKITPAHDFNDYDVGKRHDLPIINILTHDARINENAPKPYQGLDRFEARKKIVEDLKALGLLEKIENYTVKIPRGDRSKAIIEPLLTDQWFVKVAPLVKPAIDAVETGKIRFIPETWAKTYFQWMHNLEDWCISRQLWWGHRIPAWYDENNNLYVGENEKTIREKYNLPNDLTLKQDEDVLDTWFSSALWPFSILGWPEQTQAYKTFYPTNVLVTGFDIIFFWVARMIMFGLKFTGQIPFHEIYITGLVRDPDGQKMSKSKGNVIDPIDLIDGIDLNDLIKKRTQNLMQPEMAKKIEQHTRKQFPNGIMPHGTDALRFTYCSLAGTGRDIRFDLGRLEGHRNFCNKLWNATRYVLMSIENSKLSQSDSTPQSSLAIHDKWILSKLHTTIKKVHHYFKTYRFDLLAQTLHEFTWHEYCDWYLELSKPILMNEAISEAEKRGTCKTLILVLETLLRLLHPIMPFITETLWKDIAPLTDKSGKTIMLEPYPEYDESLIDEKAENTIEWIKNIILSVRNIRGEMNISPAKKVPLLLNKGNKQDKEHIETYQLFLKNLAKLSSIDWLDKQKNKAPSATALVGNLELLVLMSDVIDKTAEINRLNKEIEKLEKDLKQSESKLSNENFVKKAPPAIVEKEQARTTEMKVALKKLNALLEKLK